MNNCSGQCMNNRSMNGRGINGNGRYMNNRPGQFTNNRPMNNGPMNNRPMNNRPMNGPMNGRPMERPIDMANFPVGMTYTPMQTWGELYEPDCALKQGTLFPILDKPFLGRRAAN